MLRGHTVRSQVEREREREAGALPLFGSRVGASGFAGSLFIDEFKT